MRGRRVVQFCILAQKVKRLNPVLDTPVHEILLFSRNLRAY